ncbi:MAG: DUF1571 domain-containing protein [Bacteroidota bacterium]
MLISIDNIKTMKFHLKAIERFNGKLIFSKAQVKMSRSPLKIYLYLNGPEVLWIEDKNKDNAMVNPHGFPFINLNISSTNFLMRKNQHHIVKEVGYDYFREIIREAIKITDNNFDSYFKYQGEVEWEKHTCYFITIVYPDFKYEDYIVKKDETLVTIAHALHVNDYMLLELNSSKVSYYDDVKTEQIIKVPNAYGSKIILYIDKELLLPLVIKVYDEKGLFEMYEYHNLLVNPKIADEEFTKDYKEYGF